MANNVTRLADWIGDPTTEHPLEPLLRASEVADILKIPLKSVYDLPVPKVRLGPGRVRFRPRDLEEYITNHLMDD
ncbi:helix-turn-helix transcriptional regulator [Gemmatimonadota bacterium]